MPAVLTGIQTMSRVIKILVLAGLLNLQGCASSIETFATGAVVGAVAGVTALTCAVVCR
jgi:hypothetical protein